MTTADTVLVVRPATFRANPETAATNEFQRAVAAEPARVLREFDGLVEALDAAGVRVVVARDEPTPARPDAVFPNNWVSFHADGRVVLYPMLAESRRAEVRPELVAQVEEELGVRWPERLDWSGEAARGRFLEGTGSLVLDRARRVGLVARSPRNHPELVERWARTFGYALTAFDAFGPGGAPVYHTNVLVALGPAHAVWVRDWVAAEDRARLEAWFAATARESLVLSSDEALAFAGNALALGTSDGTPLWAISTRAERALTPHVRRRLEAHARLLPIPLYTIETLGGGSVRCTLAEVFSPDSRVRD